MANPQTRIINIFKNEIASMFNVQASPLTYSYWIAKGLIHIKGGSVLLPLLILL